MVDPSPPDVQKRLQAFFGALDKQIRGIRLYQGEGRIVAHMAAEARAALDAALADGPITLRVAPFGMVYDGRPVTDPDHRYHYLFRLYLDGVRELSLLPGLDERELGRLVTVLASDPQDGDDMVTLLWGMGLEHVRYYAVDSYAEDGASTVVGSGLVRDEAARSMDRGQSGQQIALSSSDLRALRTEDVAERVRAASVRATAQAPKEQELVTELRARWASMHDSGRFMEVVAVATGASTRAGQASPMVMDVFSSALATGQVSVVSDMLGRLAAPGVDDEPGLVALRAALLSPERMLAMAPLLMASPNELVPLLSCLVDHGRQGLVALLGVLPIGETASELQAALVDAGVDLTALHEHRLRSEDEHEIIDALDALGRTRTPAAIRAIANALNSPLGAVRQKALLMMRGAYDEAARVALGHTLRDPDKTNRLLSLEILSASGDPRVTWMLISAAEHAGFGQRDMEEQQAVVQAVAVVHDARTVAYFDGLLKRRSAMGGGHLIPLQKVAVEALAAVATEEATLALGRAAGRFLLAPEIKAAARAALARKGGAA